MLWSAPSKHHHFAYPARLERAERSGRDVGGAQNLTIAEQHPGHVERHVACTNHHGASGIERRLEVRVIRVRAVPTHELGGREAAGQLFTRDVEAPRPAAPHRDHQLIVERGQLGDRHLAPHLEPAHEVHVRMPKDAFEHRHRALDLLVIGRHAVAHQTLGSEQPLDQIHLGSVAHERLGRVEPSRPRSEHRGA